MARSITAGSQQRLQENCGIIIEAIARAKEIIGLDLISIPPNFPDIELGRRIVGIQRQMQEQAQRFDGDIVNQLQGNSNSMIRYGAKYKRLYDECLDELDRPPDVHSASNKKTAMECLKILTEDVANIVSRVDKVRNDLDDVDQGLIKVQDALSIAVKDCAAVFQKESKRKEDLSSDLIQAESERDKVWWGVVPVVVIGTVFSIGGIAAAGVAHYKGKIDLRHYLETALSTSDKETMRYLMANGIDSFSKGFQKVAEYNQLKEKVEMAKKRLYEEGTIEEKVRSCHDDLNRMENLTNKLKNNLKGVADDWRNIISFLEEIMVKLEPCETIKSLTIIKVQLKEAQDYWNDALKSAEMYKNCLGKQ